MRTKLVTHTLKADLGIPGSDMRYSNFLLPRIQTFYSGKTKNSATTTVDSGLLVKKRQCLDWIGVGKSREIWGKGDGVTKKKKRRKALRESYKKYHKVQIS